MNEDSWVHSVIYGFPITSMRSLSAIALRIATRFCSSSELTWLAAGVAALPNDADIPDTR